MGGQTNYPQQPNQQVPTNDPVAEILNFAQNGGDPEQELKRRMSQNPEQAQQFSKFVAQNRGRNPWELLYEMAAQRGINLNNYGPLNRR